MKSKVNELSIALRTLFSEWLLMTWIAYSEVHYAVAISWLHILRNPCCYIFSRVVLWIAYSEDQRATVHVAIRWEQILHNPLFFGVTCTLVEICATLFSWHFRIRGLVTCVTHHCCKLDCKCWAELCRLFFDFVYAEPMMLSVDISSRLF